jgi:hypothetical protein
MNINIKTVLYYLFICNDNINIINLSGASTLHYTGNAKITLNDGDNISGSSDIIHDTL